MKKKLSIFLSVLLLMATLSPVFSLVEERVQQDSILSVSRKVSEISQKYDILYDDTSDNAPTQTRTNRLIVKTRDNINLYDSIDYVKGLGYYFIQFEDYFSSQKAFSKYEEQGYTVQYDTVFTVEDTESESTASDIWAYERVQVNETLSALSNLNDHYDDVTVAVIDTGVDYTHELLSDRITNNAYNFSSSGDENDCMDDNGHGTNVSGIIAQCTPDNVKIEPYKLLNSKGTGTTSQLYCVLEFINNLRDKPDVINMSFGHADVTGNVDTALFEELYNNGITVVVAGGNDGTDTKYFKPSSIDSFITVSASDENNNICNFSNFGEKIDIAAPGTNIYSSSLGGGYTGGLSGTSFSSPIVAAAAAIVLMQNSSLSPDEVTNIIKDSAVPIQRKNDITWCGAGLVNFYGLINQEKANSVSFSIESGKYNEPISVELSCDENSEIIYTTDLSVPTSSNGIRYEEPIVVEEQTTIIAVALDEANNTKSDYSSANYQIIYNADEGDFEITSAGIITAYTGEHKAIIIPDEIDEIIPLEIGKNAFYESDIQYVKLPDTVENIGPYAFYNSELEAIIGTGVDYIESYAFYDCEHFYYEYLPNVDGASNFSFYYCWMITDLSFREKLTSAGNYAFKGTGLQEIDFPNLEYQKRSFELTPCYYASLPKLTKLDGGFSSCPLLQTVDIPNLNTISDFAFGDCPNLDQSCIDFSKITKIGTYGLARSYFETIDLPNCTQIGDVAFWNSKATHINAPKVERVFNRAFGGVYYLETVSLDSLESFPTGNVVFSDAIRLKNLYLPNCTNIPTFAWESIDEDKRTLSVLEYIYAPKATAFNYSESKMQYFENLKFIFAPNLTEIKYSIELPSEVTLYLSDSCTELKDGLYPNKYKIVAPIGSTAQEWAVNNGHTFLDSESCSFTGILGDDFVYTCSSNDESITMPIGLLEQMWHDYLPINQASDFMTHGYLFDTVSDNYINAKDFALIHTS